MPEPLPDMTRLDTVLDEVGSTHPHSLIPILQAIQDAYGYLPREVILETSRRTGIPASRMYGVATFYEQFYLEPRGRHVVKCCRGTACHVKNGGAIRRKIEDLLDLADGGTTGDLRFTFETVACLGTCFLAPVVMVDNDYYGGVTPNKVESILHAYE